MIQSLRKPAISHAWILEHLYPPPQRIISLIHRANKTESNPIVLASLDCRWIMKRVCKPSPQESNGDLVGPNSAPPGRTAGTEAEGTTTATAATPCLLLGARIYLRRGSNTTLQMRATAGGAIARAARPARVLEVPLSQPLQKAHLASEGTRIALRAAHQMRAMAISRCLGRITEEGPSLPH